MISDKYLSSSLEALKISSEQVMNLYKKNITFKMKSKNYRDIVSEVDKLSESIILDIIYSKYSNHNFILEEGSDILNKNDYTWYIDPLDGTVNFSKGLDTFAISIGLTFKNKIIMGLVSLPAFNAIYYTSNNKSFKNGKKLICSKTKDIHNSLNIFAFSSQNYKRKQKEYALFGKINDMSIGSLRIGSSAFALTQLAEGKVDSFIGFNVKTWDIYGGLMLALNSGCQAYIGKVFNNTIDYVVISNKSIFKNLRSIIQDNIK